MKKLALAIPFAASIVFGASSGSLAASKIDNGAGVATIRDSRVSPWTETATNARLLFLNEALYPETTTAGYSVVVAHGEQERADTAQPSTPRNSETATSARLLMTNEALYPETTAAAYSVVVAHGEQERADTAQTETFSTDTERLFCEGDICIVP
jgi:hypothetical protein